MIGCENVPISVEKDTGAQIYNKISSRYAAELISCLFVISSFFEMHVSIFTGRK
jgi:hypothetical protein